MQDDWDDDEPVKVRPPWDPDGELDKPKLLAWIERAKEKRRAAGREEADDPTSPQGEVKDDARR